MKRRPALAAAVLTLSATLAALVALSATVPVQPARATFPGRNGLIAFARGGGIFTIRADGSRRRQITHGCDGEPAFSPLGKRIACVRQSVTTVGRIHRRTYIMRADGTHLRKLIRHPRLSKYDDPAFSPSGKRIAFSGCIHNRCAIFVIKADGTRQRRLTAYRHYGDTDPDYSPNGRKIAFAREDEQRDSAIYVMRADGTHVRSLGRATDRPSQMSFSPNGRKIAFASGGAIYMMRSDGTHVRQLTPTDGLCCGAYWPSFSPNGKRIAFERRDQEGASNIWVMRVDGTHQHLIFRVGLELDWGVRP